MQKGEIYIISTGAGPGYITPNAFAALEKADLIAGYTKYLKDIASLIENKETYSTGMTQEAERCKYAVKQALTGKKVALISNGDVNVYGIAGLLLEIVEENNLWDALDITIEPGITSILAAAAKTGAPVVSDFAVISLSTLLTPLDLIELRLKNALEADFVVGIYNPLSHTRNQPYLKFLENLKKYRKETAPVVIAQNIGRETEKIYIKTVKEMLEIGDNLDMVNMSTILIVGNSTTKTINSGKKLVTQRGYQKNYDYKIS